MSDRLDVVLAGGINFSRFISGGSIMIGQEILMNILKDSFSVRQIYFDRLNKTGKLTYCLDMEQNLQNMTNLIVEDTPRIIGFHTMADSFAITVQLARRVHERIPDAVIFFGGPHATVLSEECLLAFPWLSLVCRGESEKSILPLVRTLLTGGELNTVPGITYRCGNKIVSTQSAPLIKAEELKNYTLTDRGDHPPGEGDAIHIEGGRGCPFQCSFCSTCVFWGHKHRVKPVNDIIDEMNAYYSKYGPHSFSIDHDHFTANKDFLLSFCNTLINRGSPYRWKCSSRIDVLDETIIHIMAKAGCTDIYVGIETGSERMQKVIRKNLNLQHALPLVSEMKRAGISVTVSFIYGLPDESEDDLDATLHLIEDLYLHCDCDTQLHRFFLLPSTESTGKVEDAAFFVENETGLEILPSFTYTPESLELIRKYKSLFIQHYTFPSPIRERYPYLFAVPVLMIRFREIFPETLHILITRYGIKELYLQNAAGFERIIRYENERSVGIRHDYAEYELLREIIERDGSTELKEIFRFEKDVNDYLIGDKSKSIVHEYDIDILLARQLGAWIEIKTRLQFAFDAASKQLIINKLPLAET